MTFDIQHLAFDTTGIDNDTGTILPQIPLMDQTKVWLMDSPDLHSEEVKKEREEDYIIFSWK